MPLWPPLQQLQTPLGAGVEGQLQLRALLALLEPLQQLQTSLGALLVQLGAGMQLRALLALQTQQGAGMEGQLQLRALLALY